jgi:hypothetical protein
MHTFRLRVRPLEIRCNIQIGLFRVDIVSQGSNSFFQMLKPVISNNQNWSHNWATHQSILFCPLLTVTQNWLTFLQECYLKDMVIAPGIARFLFSVGCIGGRPGAYRCKWQFRNTVNSMGTFPLRCDTTRQQMIFSFLVASFTHQEDAGTQVGILLSQFVASLQVFFRDDIRLQQTIPLEVRQRFEEYP